MASTSTKRRWWAAYRCTYGTPTYMFGRWPVYAQDTDWVKALEAAHINAGYQPEAGGYIGSKRSCPSGIGGQRCQSDGTDCSLHNYGLAWDIEYQWNPHFRQALTEADLWMLYRSGRTKYNPDIIDGILRVTNLEGTPMFRWLGYSIGDTMHWEIDVPPDHSEVDWTTVGDLIMPKQQWDQMIDSMFAAGIMLGDPEYWKRMDPDSPEWVDFWRAFATAIA